MITALGANGRWGMNEEGSTRPVTSEYGDFIKSVPIPIFPHDVYPPWSRFTGFTGYFGVNSATAVPLTYEKMYRGVYPLSIQPETPDLYPFEEGYK